MNRSLKKAFGAAAVAVVGVACNSVAVAPSSAGAPSAAVSPSPVAPSAAVAQSPASTSSPDALDTSTWTTYVSRRYGFSIARPTDWTEDPAAHDWTLAMDAIWPNEATEHFEGGPEGAQVGVSAWSVAVDRDASIDSWLSTYCQKNSVSCTGIPRRAVTTMDGHAGTLVAVNDVPHALFLVDSRIYVVACWRPDTDPSVLKYSGSFRLVEAFVSTMKLLREGPARSAAAPPS